MAIRDKLRTSLWITLALAGLNLIVFNALIAGWSTLRVDLTEEGVYSITPATRQILGSLEEDVHITGYFSKRTHPKLSPLIPSIVDLLAEYRALSKDRVKIEVIDPGEDEAAEEEANSRFGVESTPFRLASKYESGIVNAYFALVVRYGDQYVRYGFSDLIEIEPLPDGDIDVRTRNLEYDLTRAIKKVVFGFRSTAELFERVEGPVRLAVVWTPESLPEILKDIPEAVRAAATELMEKSGGSFALEEIDPSTDPAKQMEVASTYGARPMSLGLFSDQSFYLYGFLHVGESVEQLMLVGEGVSAATVRETVENALRRHTPGFLKTVGVAAPGPGLPPELMAQLQAQGRMPQMPPPEFDQIKRYLEQEYQVVDVDLAGEAGVPSRVDILLVVKPKDLKERAVYNLDQYLMRGGRVVICSGSFEPQFGSAELALSPVKSGLDDWLAHYGVDVLDTLILDDRNQPLPIPEVRRTVLGNLRTWVMKPYPYLVEVREDGLVNREVAARIEGVGIYWGSPLAVDAAKATGLEVVDLLRSSEKSWTSDDTTRVRFAEYVVPSEGTEARLLGTSLSGKFKSYFAGRGAPGGDTASDPAAEATPPSRPEVPLEESPETRLVVIGNAEFLSDFVASALNRAGGGFFLNNLAFVQNLIDWTTLDNDLIAIRARGGGARRLERTERSTQVIIETANYLIPVAMLCLLGAWRLWRRRNTAPLVDASAMRGTPLPGTPRRAEG